MLNCSPLTLGTCDSVGVGGRGPDGGAPERKFQRTVMTGSRLKVDVPPTGSSAWRGSQLDAWTQQRLAASQEELAQWLVQSLTPILEDHRNAILASMRAQLGPAWASARAPGSTSGDPLGRRTVEPPGTAVRMAESSGAASAALDAGGGHADGHPSTRAEEARGERAAAPPAAPRRADVPSKAEAAAQSEPPSPTARTEPRVQPDLPGPAAPPWQRKPLTDSRRSGNSGVEALVGSAAFELAYCIAIMANVVIMAVEMQYTGCTIASAIGHPDCLQVGWHGAADVFAAMSVTFSAIYVTEFALRLAVGRSQALVDGWMWLDFLLLVVGSLDAAKRLGGNIDLGVNLTVLRSLRLARLAKLVRYAGRSEQFPSLFLITTSLRISRHPLKWTILILFSVMSIVGMVMSQLLHGYFSDDGSSLADRQQVFDYFGTFTRTLITMCELTLGNWAPPARLLMSRVGELWGLFIIAYRCVFCFAMVNIAGAVFNTETSRAVAEDDEVAMLRKKTSKKLTMQKVTGLFKEIDFTGDGMIAWHEFEEALNHPGLKQYFSTLDLELGDLKSLFSLMDDGDGVVCREEFISGLMTLRGQARNADMLVMMRDVKRIVDVVARLDKRFLLKGVLPSSPRAPDSDVARCRS
uniref:EF-hand domain-containing protein n=1 Tax=Alexandrium catenella TaxID=2925 RepID=A0A7S1RN73_ALECA|mmetsp:Transcript_65112/g.173609  ORF Transcript_65112/g.173609 Transcript_65112/m.173609 type:complete len:637 (+) Transcript_65112:68-1978(+)